MEYTVVTENSTITDSESSDLDDNLLMMLCQQGKEEAFYQLVKRYQHTMVNYIYRMVHDKETAIELAQDVFVKIYKNISHYNPGLKFSTWLYRIATNTAIDSLRKHNRKGRNLVDTYDMGPEEIYNKSLSTGFISNQNPEKHTLRAEIQKKIDEAINELSPETKQIFIMKEIERLPIDEISAITGVKIGTIKSRLHRARNFLQEQLSPFLFGGKNEVQKSTTSN